MTFQPPSDRPAGPPPWPPAESDPDGGPRRRGVPQGVIVAAAALVGALLVLAVVVILNRGGDDVDAGAPEPAAPTTTEAPPADDEPDTTEPPNGEPVPAPEPPPAVPEVTPIDCPQQTPGPICEAAEFVQVQTGRAFREFPAHELLDEDAFRDQVFDEERTEEDLAQVEATARTMVAIGLIDPDLDLLATLEDLVAASALGLYDIEDDVLYVRGTEFTPLVRIVMVHELVHALDDQWFDLGRLHDDELDSEEAFGFLSLIEGHARVIENRYRETLPAAERSQAVQEELRLVLESGIDVLSIPPVLLEQLGAPYLLGERLVEAILAEGGVEGLAEAFADPPTTASQVLHPERYFAREPAVEVAAPPADGEIVDSEVVGELGFRFWLDDDEAAVGWAGDRYVTWDDGTAACLRVDVVMQTPADLERLRAAFAEWAQGGERRSIEDVEVVDRDGLRVTSCAG
jgi:hypothetical protein